MNGCDRKRAKIEKPANFDRRKTERRTEREREIEGKSTVPIDAVLVSFIRSQYVR